MRDETEALIPEEELESPQENVDSTELEALDDEDDNFNSSENQAQQASTKKKGKSRNARLKMQVEQLREADVQNKAQLQALTQQLQQLMGNNNASSVNAPEAAPMPADGQAQPFDAQQFLAQQKAQQFAQDLNDLRLKNEEVDDMLSDPSHPYQSLSQGVVHSLKTGALNLSPQRLFDIAKHFPKEIKRLRSSVDPVYQMSHLLRLDGKLEASKETQLKNVSQAVEPTGVIKGGSANISSDLSPKERLAQLRNKQMSAR